MSLYGIIINLFDELFLTIFDQIYGKSGKAKFESNIPEVSGIFPNIWQNQTNCHVNFETKVK